MVQARVGSEGTVGMMVRMSEGLRDRIKAAAEANGRSQNSEIVATLEEMYPATSKRDVVQRALTEMLNLIMNRSENAWDTALAKIAAEHGLEGSNFFVRRDADHISIAYRSGDGMSQGIFADVSEWHERMHESEENLKAYLDNMDAEGVKRPD